MEYRDEKYRLYRIAVEEGLDGKSDFGALTGAPLQYVQRWVKKFFKPPEQMEFPENPQLVNRFALGADPEWAFTDATGAYYYAEQTGMTTILPFGCDMAGRQAELRAESSRFALRVVASMTDALRWIPQFYAVDKLQWVATPYIGHDGCGGHVHFGRKRPNREEEVQALDATLQLLLAVGVFEPVATQNRIQLSRGGYGRSGDIRLQSHGYEYRSYPTWMYSPWGAYFTLVISKLMLYYGKPFKVLPGRAPHQLVNLLRLYRYEDDDAAIALKAWHLMGFPKPDEKCFKGRWGVETNNGLPKRPIMDKYFPLSLVPEGKTCQELFAHFTKGSPMTLRAPKPTWEPFELGEKYMPVFVQPHVLEVPNIAQGLISKDYYVVVGFSQDHNTIQISGTLAALDQQAITQAFAAIGLHVGFRSGPAARVNFVFSVPKTVTEDRGKVRQVREILSNTQLFPICKGRDFKTTDWSRWVSPVVWAEPKLQGKILLEVRGQKLPPRPMYREEF